MTRPVFQNPQLDGGPFILEGTNGVGILLFHGFTSTTVEVRPLAEFLNQAGYTVAAPLLPGHGTTPEDALKIKKRDWIGTAEQAYIFLSQNVNKIIAGGESMGALLALDLAITKTNIQGLILFAPAVAIKGQWKALFAAPFIKIMPKKYLSDAEKTPDVLPWQGYNVLPVPAVAQFYKLQVYVRRRLKNVRQPTLIFQGKMDYTIDPNGAEKLYKQISSSKKNLIWKENSGHTIILGQDYQSIYQQTLEFVQRVTEQAAVG